jgi:hypothetical protein
MLLGEGSPKNGIRYHQRCRICIVLNGASLVFIVMVRVRVTVAVSVESNLIVMTFSVNYSHCHSVFR